ncbi:MAG: ATP-binding cassette domain-containing protein, partial [Acidimicrobiales bacterium]
AGRYLPSLGQVVRDGRAGLGERGGTAMIFQRPESQVLGVRVRDDLCWGLPIAERPDIASLLGEVGLTGFEDRETSTLSGGQLQRLAIASALARKPRLLISDEATAMIDSSGREEVVELLRKLADSGLAVVHVTHRMDEAKKADLVALMGGGRILRLMVPTDDDPAMANQQPEPATPSRYRPFGSSGPPPILASLRRVGYVYANGTPWARRALEGVDIDVAVGEGLVVTGDNGSGKTTLAWILGGLMAPTEGEARIGGRPLDTSPESVGVAFQHARLQLLKPTVLADVRLGRPESEAEAALRSVALLPSVMGPRKVDDLSGGEQRRVALAGLLVRRPELLVLDEPYAGLDDEARRALASVLQRLRSDHGIATVVVSHDLDDVSVLGDRLLELEDGRIVQDEVLSR